jgi:predicted DNA-binding protein (UPF0251 family)
MELFWETFGRDLNEAKQKVADRMIKGIGIEIGINRGEEIHERRFHSPEY